MMNLPRSGVLLLVPVLFAFPLAAQASGPWSACNMDSLSTWNCARYYSGTVSLTSELKGADLHQTYRVVATVTEGSGAAEVQRFDRSRNVIIEGELGGAPIGTVMTEIQQLQAARNWPPCVRELPAGDAEILG